MKNKIVCIVLFALTLLQMLQFIYYSRSSLLTDSFKFISMSNFKILYEILYQMQ
jgi:hypothetical protein